MGVEEVDPGGGETEYQLRANKKAHTGSYPGECVQPWEASFPTMLLPEHVESSSQLV